MILTSECDQQYMRVELKPVWFDSESSNLSVLQHSCSILIGSAFSDRPVRFSFVSCLSFMGLTHEVFINFFGPLTKYTEVDKKDINILNSVVPAKTQKPK